MCLAPSGSAGGLKARFRGEVMPGTQVHAPVNLLQAVMNEAHYTKIVVVEGCEFV